MSRSPHEGRLLLAFLLAVALVAPSRAGAQAPEVVPPERTAAREWFRDARFGLFVHWGVYSLLGQGEWVMQNRPVKVPDYEWMASTFNPVRFDAREWVAVAKAAGMRYITITARHHDGFSMFASDATSYDIVDWTPFRRDPLAELAAECRRQGIRLFFYYSQLDWLLAIASTMGSALTEPDIRRTTDVVRQLSEDVRARVGSMGGP